MRYKIKILYALPFLFFAYHCYASAYSDTSDLFPSKTVYFGVNMGGGYTTWKYLLDTTDQGSQQPSLPSRVKEGGPSWGVVFGFDVAKNFAIELQYMEFADAHVDFAPGSSYFDSNGNPVTSMVSKTDAYSLSGKFFVPVGVQTHLRAFAAVGAGLVERRDPLIDEDPNGLPPGNVTLSCVSPYMSAGLDYNFTRHWIVESGFQYYTGFGASEINPVDSFVPFAWDAYGRLAYQL
ncbi:MAG: hypothetical protein ACD_42C00408G0007 [uncultured bacterium]|nr:MAG: hypothetical protein ACD_42C00408G0007 [uncultured bacterium]